MDRRRFLKIAGVSGILGALGGLTAVQVLKPGEIDASESVAETSQGIRLGMVVDVKGFKSETDFQKCIDACHSVHNVPDYGKDSKDEIKWIWKEKYENAFPESGHTFISEEVKNMGFLVLCNHCQKPACVRVCPTQATFKRTQDGIVIMDMHRCIGCRFCMAACPYGARSFNWRDPLVYFANKTVPNPRYPRRTIGVVEKCNFCAERLAVSQPPACVEKSNGSLIFGNLNDPNSDVRKILRTNFAIVRKPEAGTQPNVYYIIGGRNA